MGLPMGLNILGGMFGAMSSVMAGQAQASALKAEAQIAEQNARTAERQGVEALKAGAREEASFRRRARQFQGAQRAEAAASGAQIAGSPLAALADTSMGIEEDATELRLQVLQQKWEHDVRQTDFLNRASAARSAAKSAQAAGWIGGFTSILGTGAKITAGLPAKGASARPFASPRFRPPGSAGGYFYEF